MESLFLLRMDPSTFMPSVGNPLSEWVVNLTTAENQILIIPSAYLHEYYKENSPITHLYMSHRF